MTEVLRDSDGIAHVVGVSGGKDSTALALALHEREPRPYTYVYTPTGDELPAMVAHMRRLEGLLGSKIIRLTNGTLHSQIKLQKMLPNPRARWCTRLLKLKPYGDFMRSIAPAVSYIGLRDDEENRDGARPGGDYAPLASIVTQDFPFRRWEWGLEEVWGFLNKHGIEIPERTDCARCPYQRLGEWYVLWRDHIGTYRDAEDDELAWGHTFRSRSRDSWPASLRDLRLLFEAGTIPEVSLRMMEKRKGMCRACSM